MGRTGAMDGAAYPSDGTLPASGCLGPSWVKTCSRRLSMTITGSSAIPRTAAPQTTSTSSGTEGNGLAAPSLIQSPMSRSGLITRSQFVLSRCSMFGGCAGVAARSAICALVRHSDPPSTQTSPGAQDFPPPQSTQFQWRQVLPLPHFKPEAQLYEPQSVAFMPMQRPTSHREPAVQ